MKKIFCLWLISCGVAFGQASVTNSTTGLKVAGATSSSQGVMKSDNFTTFINSVGVISTQGFTADYFVPIASGHAVFSSDVSNKVNYLLLNTNVTTSSLVTVAGSTTPGWVWHAIICQDGTGGRTFVAPTSLVDGMAPMVAFISGAAANVCAEQSFIWSTTIGAFIPYDYGLAASPLTLQTNGTNNGSQSMLNIAAGSNITASNTGGTVTISGPTPYSLGVGVGNGNLTLGAGAGTGATGSLTGTAGNMQLTINAGTTPTIGGIIATINITAGRPSFCVYSSNTNRISAITTSISGASMEVDDNSTAGLTGLATYIWNISCP